MPTTGDNTIKSNIIIPTILTIMFTFFFFFFLLILYTSIIIIHKIIHIYKIKEYNFMGDTMIRKYSNIKKIILPNKRINFFVIGILFLGVILGSIYANIIGMNDKNLVIDKVKVFIDNINTNSLNTFMVFKNSMGINFSYLLIIWFLGMSIIGIIFSIVLLFLKGFIFGFSMASFIITYGIKGIILAFIYLIFGQLLNVIFISILSIYSIIFSIKLIKNIISKDPNCKFFSFIKNYLIILVFCSLISLVSSVSETFILPSLIKLVIKLFI